MSPRVVTYEPDMPSLGRAVLAIGAFDGVHLGHCALLEAAAADAEDRGETAIAVTFDRDPDQIVTPEAAAPQLLTLEDKVTAIRACGVEVVLVVPFTPAIAALSPQEFLDTVIGRAARVSAVHVGENFRFGRGAAGDASTLCQWAEAHDARLVTHVLLTVDGSTVSSTRIRTSVSAGDVEEAARLLGRTPRVCGTVVHGRGQGAALGAPTANVKPVPFAAVPGDGIYAGRVRLEDGTTHPAAVAVGIPPTFPYAKDYIEAHLIGYSGHLYGQRVTIEFVKKLRDQRAFASLEELIDAIQADISEAASVLDAAVADDRPYSCEPGAEDVVVEDPAALEAAERAVATMDSHRHYYAPEVDSWVPVTNPRRLSGVFSNAGFSAALVTAPLEAAGIPYAWDPYPPEEMPSFRPAYGIFDRRFTLLVPADDLEEARELLGIEE